MVKPSGKTIETWQVMSELLAMDSAIELMGSGKRRPVYYKQPSASQSRCDSVRLNLRVPAANIRVVNRPVNGVANIASALPEPRKPRKMKWAYVSILIFILVSLGMGFGYLYLENYVLTRNVEARYIEQSIISEYASTTEVTVHAAQALVIPTVVTVPSTVYDEILTEPEQIELLSDFSWINNEPIAPILLTPMPRLEFMELRRAFGNDDIVGHLRIEGTAIDYVVVQGADNDFYMRHNIWQNRSSAGWIFLDYAVDLRQQDQNMVIYGHNMRNGSMFHDIRRFRNYSFFRENRNITFSTIYAEYEWEIFAFYTAHVNFPYTVINFPNEATYAYMLEQFMSMSMHDSGITVTSSDRILTLSTCTNANANERFVLQARLVE